MVRVMSVVPSKYCAPVSAEAEAARLHGNVGLLGRLVVDDRAVRAVGEDGVEALLKIVLTLGAKRFELFRRAELGDRLFADRVLEPVDEARDGHAVLDVGKALVLLLRGRLHRFHQLNGARAVEDFSALRHALQNAVVGALAVEAVRRVPGGSAATRR